MKKKHLLHVCLRQPVMMTNPRNNVSLQKVRQQMEKMQMQQNENNKLHRF